MIHSSCMSYCCALFKLPLKYSLCRWSVTPSVPLSPDDLGLTVIQETPGMNAPSLVKTEEFFFKNEYSSPRADHGSMVLPEPSSFQPTSVRSSYAGLIKEHVTTPETKANTIQPTSTTSCPFWLSSLLVNLPCCLATY